MAKPVCVHCGKSYGQRWAETQVLKYLEGEEEPPYRGNGIVLKSRSRKVGLGSGRTGGFGHPSIDYGPGDVVVHREVWDGETYAGGYDPFCTLRCALNYARRAYEGHAIVVKGANKK